MNSARIRKWLRALHRDAGYLAVGLTFVYAVSGLAVNHIADWDPNFTQIEETHELDLNSIQKDVSTLHGQERSDEIARRILSKLGRGQKWQDVYAVDADNIDITLENTTLYVNFSEGSVREAGQKERLLLRVANWLHLNRGKQAWTYVADGYALVLLFLATSGLFMIPGKKGIRGRKALFVALGAAVPILYVVLSGGPGGG